MQTAVTEALVPGQSALAGQLAKQMLHSSQEERPQIVLAVQRLLRWIGHLQFWSKVASLFGVT
eukprot:3913290-Amphidinium_carterae.3